MEEKKEALVIVKPNLLVGFVFQIVKFSAIIIAFIVLMIYLNYVAGFNVPLFLWEMVKQIFGIASSSAEVISLNFGELIVFSVEDFARSHLIQALALAALALITVLGDKCWFFKDRIVYKKGKITLKEESLPLRYVKGVDYTKYFNMFNLGTISILLQENDLNVLKVSFVNNLETKYKGIESILKDYRNEMKEKENVMIKEKREHSAEKNLYS